MILWCAFIRNKHVVLPLPSDYNMPTKRHSPPSLLDMFSSASAKRPASQDRDSQRNYEENPSDSRSYHELASVSSLSSGTDSSGTSTSQCSESACSFFCCSDLSEALSIRK